MICKFPKTHGRVYGWARAFAVIFKEKGQKEAGHYASTQIPVQFHKAMTGLAQDEYAQLIKEEREDE